MKFDTSMPLRVVGDVLFRNIGLKLLALVMTAVLFVSTRDDVTRAFEVPLRIVEDPDRVLVTELPDTITVKVRGPWTRLNRLQAADFEAAVFDLAAAEPGPLEIHDGAIVMPPGVVLSAIENEHVDLRFEPVVKSEVTISPTVLGEPASDYRILRIETNPPHWQIRGGRSQVQAVQKLITEPLEITGAAADVRSRLQLVRPKDDVVMVGSGAEMPRVEVHVRIEPVRETRDVPVPVPVPDELDPTAVIPPTYTVQVTGPLPQFRVLERLGVAFPVEAEVVPLEGESADGGRIVEVRFRWSGSVPGSVRESLSFDHGIVRVSLPGPPKPPPPPPQPQPGIGEAPATP